MSSFKKRTDFFLTSKWVLLFVFVVSIGMLIGFAMARDMFGIVLFALIGFLTSFFSKNMIVILLISIGLTGVIAGMYPVELRRIEGFGEDESFGQIEGFGEETDPDEEEEENEEKKDTEKKPEKDTEKPETKKPEKETKKPETKKPEKETKKPEKDKEKDTEKKPEKDKETKKPESKGSDDIQKILGDSEKYSFTKMPKFDLPSTDEVMGGFEDKLLNIYKETMQNLVEKANLNN
jgi:hypothetical protein